MAYRGLTPQMVAQAALGGYNFGQKWGRVYKDWRYANRGNGGGGKRIKRSNRGYVGNRGYYGRFNRASSYAAARGERKFFDLAFDDTSVPNTGTILDSANEIAQGTGEDDRLGRKCTIVRFDWRYTIQLLAGTTADASEIIRVIIYLDKQCNGVTATVANILETVDYQSFYNLSNSNRFSILYDKTHAINATAAFGATGDGTIAKSIARRFGKNCRIPLEFSSTTGIISEIRSNNIGILLIARDGGIASFQSSIRLRFTG